jgi:hypothetical protein
VISCPCCHAAGVRRRNLPAAISSSSWFPRPIFIPAAGFQCRSVLLSLRFLRHADGCFIATEYSRPRRRVPSQPARTRSKFQAASFFGDVALLQFPAAIFILRACCSFSGQIRVCRDSPDPASAAGAHPHCARSPFHSCAACLSWSLVVLAHELLLLSSVLLIFGRDLIRSVLCYAMDELLWGDAGIALESED